MLGSSFGSDSGTIVDELYSPVINIHFLTICGEELLKWDMTIDLEIQLPPVLLAGREKEGGSDYKSINTIHNTRMERVVVRLVQP